MKLMKVHNGQLIVASRVHTPTYSLRAAEFALGAVAADGWVAVSDDVELADFALPWKRPASGADAYSRDAVVTHAGQTWKSLVDANVWEPGVSAWALVSSATPVWVQPTGAHDAYPEGFVVLHKGKTWRSLVPNNVWQPPVNWRETFLTPPNGAPKYPAWVQPTGAGDAYKLGDRVQHAGKNWESTYNNNVWEPGVFGWVEV